jgi:hypothetical protein
MLHNRWLIWLRRPMHKLAIVIALGMGARLGAGPNPDLGVVNLAAGAGPAGYIDGDFAHARFLSPTSLCVDQQQRLWVCDSGNRVLRMVDLKNHNLVSSPFKGMAEISNFFSSPGRWSYPVAIVPLEADGRFLFLSKGGSEIDEIMYPEGKVAPVYRGKALSQMEYFAAGKSIFALEEKSRKVLRAPFTPGKTINFSEQFSGLTQTAFLISDSTFIGFQVPASLGFRADVAQDVSTPASASPFLFPDQFPSDDRVRIFGGHFDDNTYRYYFWVLGQGSLYWPDPASHQIRPLELPNAHGLDPNSMGLGPDFTAISGCWMDSESRSLFLSDAPNNRIYKVKDYDWNQGAFGTGSPTWNYDFSYPKLKPPHTTRILFYGGSFSYETENSSVGKLVGLNKRLEYYLNLKSLANGSQQSYEVMFDGRALGWAGYGTDIISHAIAKIEEKKDYGQDAYFVQLDPMDILFCGLAFLYRPLGPDGIPEDGMDPEFALSKDPETKYKGLAAEIYHEVKAHQDKYAPNLTIDGDGHIVFNHLTADVFQYFGDNRLTQLFTRATALMLHVLYEKVQKISPGSNLYVGFYLNRNFISLQEVRSGVGRFSKMSRVCEYPMELFKSQIKDEHIVLLDFTEKMMVAYPSHHPMYIILGAPADHLSQSGAELAGYLTCEAIWPFLQKLNN